MLFINTVGHGFVAQVGSEFTTLENYLLRYLENKVDVKGKFWKVVSKIGLGKYYYKCVFDEVGIWLNNKRSDLNNAYEAELVWLQYQHEWHLTFTQYLSKTKWVNGHSDKFVKWPIEAIQIYEAAYPESTLSHIMSNAVVEGVKSMWWQKQGMFCPKGGMHKIYENGGKSFSDLLSNKILFIRVYK